MKITILSLAILFMGNLALAKIKSESPQYKAGETVMEGYVAFDEGKTKSRRPAVIVVHDWMGLADFQKHKADDLAKLGYVAFAADIYGKGVRPKNAEEAGQFAGKYKADRNLLRARIKAAYDTVTSMKNVDPKKVVVMGYCFGGTSALELARSGTPLAGTATFHAGLSNPTPADAKNIKGKVLIMHGADDPFVPAAEVTEFKKEMADAKIPMEFIAYPGAVHGFAMPSAGGDNSKGMAYNAEADKKSWETFKKFLKSVF